MFRRLSAIAVLGLSSLTGCSGRPDGDAGNASLPVINGWKAQHSDYPSVVALSSPWSKSAFCTGTLVEADVVITAAHCVAGKGADELLVAYGADDVSNTDDELFHRVYAVEHHPDFTQMSCDDPWVKCPITDEAAWNDVAVILLREPIIGATCAPILPPARFGAALTVGTDLRIAGYGQNWIEESSKLYAGDVPIVLKTGHEIELGLTGPTEPNACFGDSGGPAYVADSGHVAVTGITSRSAYQAVCGQGAVYTLPGAYSDWFAGRSIYHRCMRDTGGACQSGEYSAPPPCQWTVALPLPGLTKPADAALSAGGAPTASGVEHDDTPGCDQSNRSVVFGDVYGWVAGSMILAASLMMFWRSRPTCSD